ncbi:MAG: hypothetical protein ACE5R4_02565 [Armatimonadota bacterium]
MAAEEAQERPEVEEFKCERRPGLWVGFGIGCGIGALLTIMGFCYELGMGIFMLVGFGLVLCVHFAYTAILVERPLARLSSEGITAPRHFQSLRMVHLAWSAIERVHCINMRIPLVAAWRRLELYDRQPRLRITIDEGWFSRLDELRHAIVTRAGLTQRTEYHWGTVYTRPDEEPST